jgi:dTDP-4-dehydrorhamnose reductase
LNSESCVWITGAGGLVGANLLRLAPALHLIGLTRDALDLTDFNAVKTRFLQDKPSLIIHGAAMSRSVDCQSNPVAAHRINVEATAFLAGLAQDIGFIFFSTDLVFDGRKGGYVEEDAPNPLSIYGETKLAAEQTVAKNPRHTIVRLALCGGASPKGRSAFNEELQSAWRAGRVPKFFSDEFRSPIAAPVAARAIWSVAGQPPPGVYHLGGSARLSRLEIGRLVAARHPELSPRFESASLRGYQGAPRAPDTSLRCDKMQKLLPFPLPGLDQWLTDNPEEPF